ncbi:MAG: Nitrate/nitrite response regulator protein [Sphingomonadales bacterium]|nr:Nitrate/nitrite response regulator protein [Sphingomonadales bacterium]
MRDPIRVALLSRNAIVREGLRRILADEHFEVTQSVDRSSQLNELAIREDDDGSFLIVIDNAGPDGIADVEILQGRFPEAHIVLLSDEFNFDAMVQAFRLGVDGYIVKHISCEPLIGSLQLIAMGEKVMPSELVQALEFQIPTSRGEGGQSSLSTANLSGRECEILGCLVMGFPNKIVSRRLGISEATVKVHVKAILRKLLVQNRTQAAIWAVNHGVEAHSCLAPIMDTRMMRRSSDQDPPGQLAA